MFLQLPVWGCTPKISIIRITVINIGKGTYFQEDVLKPLPGRACLPVGRVSGGLSHHKWIPVIILEGETGSPDHTFQRVISYMNRQLDLLTQPFVQSAQQCSTTCNI